MIPVYRTMKKFSYQLGPKLGPKLLKRVGSSHEMVAGAAGIQLAVNNYLLDAGELQNSS